MDFFCRNLLLVHFAYACGGANKAERVIVYCGFHGTMTHFPRSTEAGVRFDCLSAWVLCAGTYDFGMKKKQFIDIDTTAMDVDSISFDSLDFEEYRRILRVKMKLTSEKGNQLFAMKIQAGV